MCIKRNSGRVGLQCEPLEPRRLMSGLSIWTSLDGSGGQVLHIIGTAGNDEILVSPGKLTIVADAATVYGPFYGITGFAIDGSAGDDLISIDEKVTRQH